MEYGLNNNIKIYSGGLGILAGDYLKEASDSNVNMVGIGFLYKYGYFKQHLSVYGEQMVDVEPIDYSLLPVLPVMEISGSQRIISLNMPGRKVYAKIWKIDVGRIPLYLLDTEHELNLDQDKSITHQLYGGDWENRLKQEILLGLGGIRLIRSIGINPDLYHCNEGHAALINVERLSILTSHENYTFDEAMEIVRASSLFTTHTPVPAGHDTFSEDLIRTYLRHIPERLRIDWERFVALGKVNADDPNENFSMSILAAKTSQEMNGVSWLHGKVSQEMFQHLYHGFFPEELHINYVTNGVHYPTWTSKLWRNLYETEFGPDFLNDLSNPDHWKKIYDVPDAKIWEIKQSLRKKLIDYVKERYEKNWIIRHEDPKQLMEVLNSMDENTLTIGFARRFATYKRAHLLFNDLERLSAIVNNKEKPVQIIFAGKAHPNDKAGQDLIKYIVGISRKPEFIGKIVFLENYNIELAKRLVKGVDIWLNTPTRPLEASGTSGQKAVMNGVLNFSVLDGWWLEGYKKDAGWALDEERHYEDQSFQDEFDAQTIYNIFENEIIPAFYDRNEKGIPVKWVGYIKNCIAQIAPVYTTKRMIDDYHSKFYLKMFKRIATLRDNDFKLAISLASWKRKILRSWEKIEVISVDTPSTSKNKYRTGEKYHVEVALDLKELIDENICVEIVMRNSNNPQKAKVSGTVELELDKKLDTMAFYVKDIELTEPGNIDFSLRIFIKNENLPHKQDFNVARWI
jgi:phosphorylase/glycogen(starch) synthase